MKEEKNEDIFPSNFFWGASTASHQVEGGNHNQWTAWEKAHAHELAQTAHRRIMTKGIKMNQLRDWETIKFSAEDPQNYISGKGIEHEKRYKDDFAIIKDLNLNAFRFGIEWSKIEPKEGQWDQSVIDHYKDYINELRSKHIEPFINIWHWTVPVWFAELGAFEKRKNLKYFYRFIDKVADELLDDIQYVITINEPNVYSSFSYSLGEWPPQEKSFIKFSKVYLNLARAHNKSYKILKEKKPTLQIGIAQQLGNIQAKRPHNILDELVTKAMRYFWNWWFLRRIRKHQDFVGINYYFTDYYRYNNAMKPDNPRVPVNDLGWYMEPEGIYPLLLRTWSHYKKPIFITENGVADGQDQYRQWWIEETIVAMERAISEGVDLRGYFHWSLLDNFEWSYGWWPKFGLVAVDRENGMKRTIRPSAKWFADLIKNIQSND